MDRVKYEHKNVDLIVEGAGYLGSTGRAVTCETIETENYITFGCGSTGAPGQLGPMDSGPVVLTNIWVSPSKTARLARFLVSAARP